MVGSAMGKPIEWIVVLALLCAPSTWALEAGPTPYFSYTASGFAMGNAVVSLPAHPSNVWTNPGGLAFQKGVLFYAAPHDEVGLREEIRDRIFVGSYAGPMGGTVGAALMLRQIDNVAVPGGGPPPATDMMEVTSLLSYGRMISGTFGAGLSIVGYRQKADADALDGDLTVGITIGLLRSWAHDLRGELPLDLRWGMAVVNLGPSFDVGVTETNLPLNIRTGFSAKWEKDRGNHVVGALDLYYLPRDELMADGSEGDRFGGGIGLEGKISGVVALRGGYVWDQERDRTGESFGFGVGNELYPHIGGMIEYAHSPGDLPGDRGFADHLGVRIYWVP